MVTAVKGNRTFQKREEPTAAQDLAYSPLPLDVMWAIYARQSSQAQVLNNTESTEMQTDDLIAWLVERGVQDGHWHLFDADLGLSGTLRIDQRSALQELVDRIKADEIKAVLVYQISRLFRDDTGVEYNVFAKDCREHNCVLVTANGMVFNFNNRMHMKIFRFLAEYAAEFIPQQIGLLHAARLRKARRGLYAGLGSVPRGYIVDYDKHSLTFKKFIPYLLHSDKVLSLFERFYALEADFATLCREVEEMPFVFANFDPSVDRRNIRDKNWKKVPGGYHISRRGLQWLLTNPVFVGWWIINGDIISTKNHTPIIPPEKEYLFWYAFEHLSAFTTEGEVNSERTLPTRRFYRRSTVEEVGLLKNRIQAPDGISVYVHQSEGVHSYCRPHQQAKVFTWSDSEIEVDLVDDAFTKRLFVHLRETRDFDVFRQWIQEVVKKQASLLDSITTQLEEIDRQQEAILDDRLALRTQISQQVKEALLNDLTASSEAVKQHFEEEAAGDFERLRRRSAKLAVMEKELRAKLPTVEEDEQLHAARTFADFETELEKLAQVWHLKPFKEKREFVNLLVKSVTLSVAATHWIRLDISWTHPAWESETLFIYRRRGIRSIWTDAERELLGSHYETAEREIILSLMPHKSWNAIKKEARNLGLHRPHQKALPIGEYTTWSDWQFIQEQGITPESRTLIVHVGQDCRFAARIFARQKKSTMQYLKFLSPVEPEIGQ